MLFTLNEEKKINVEIDITFKKLWNIQFNHKDDYNKFMTIFNNGAKTPFDYLFIIYIGYLCENKEAEYTFNDFMEMADFNTRKLSNTASALMMAKKK